jgi:hypothetical protein
MTTGSNETIAVSETTLWKRLNERGILKSTEEKRSTLKVRRMLGKKRENVLHLDTSVLLHNPTSECSTTCTTVDPDDPKTWPEPWFSRYQEYRSQLGNHDAALFEAQQAWRREEPQTAPVCITDCLEKPIAKRNAKSHYPSTGWIVLDGADSAQ